MTGQVANLNPLAATKTLQSLQAWALALMPGETVQAETAAKLPLAIQAAAKQLEPAPVEIMAVEIRKLIDFAKAFNIPREDLKTATEAYREALETVPADLISEAFRNVRSSHKWGMRLPLPSEILAQISDQLSERRTLLAKLRIAQRNPVNKPSPESTEADRARVKEIMANWRTSRAG